jgi:hypothetical protein
MSLKTARATQPRTDLKDKVRLRTNRWVAVVQTIDVYDKSERLTAKTLRSQITARIRPMVGGGSHNAYGESPLKIMPGAP